MSDPQKDGPDTAAVPFLALRHQVVFPGQKAEIHASRPRTKALLAALAAEGLVGRDLATFVQRDAVAEEPGTDDLFPIGCRVRVLSAQQHGEVGWALEVEGVERIRLTGVTDSGDWSEAQIEVVREHEGHSPPTVPTVLAPGAFEQIVAVLQVVDPEERPTQHEALEAYRRSAQEAQRGQPPLPAFEDLHEVWPLQETGAAEIESRLERGAITTDEAADLRHFREHGWVLWEKLIDDELVDRFVDDLAAIKAHPGEYLLTDHRRQRPFRISGRDFDHYENVYDSYVHLESSRRVCYHPRIHRFLELVFDADPVATQQLLFQRSNEHMLHQDTAFVCVEESLQLLATWIALEDVVPGRGELTYFDKSHRIEPFRFGDGSKRFAGGGHDPNDVAAELLRRCQQAGCEKIDFLAKKGDVFLWAADLVHGSNKRTASPEETRRSCVTHYCPEWTRPVFMRGLPEHRAVEAFPEGKISSTFYRLPAKGRPIRPTPQMPEPC